MGYAVCNPPYKNVLSCEHRHKPNGQDLVPTWDWVGTKHDKGIPFPDTKHGGGTSSLKYTLSGAKCDWGIRFLSTKPKSYGASFLVPMYERRSPGEGPLPKKNKVSETSATSVGDLGTERSYLRTWGISQVCWFEKVPGDCVVTLEPHIGHNENVNRGSLAPIQHQQESSICSAVRKGSVFHTDGSFWYSSVMKQHGCKVALGQGSSGTRLLSS